MAGNQPVTHFVSDFFLTIALLFEPVINFFTNFAGRATSKWTRIYHCAFADITWGIIFHAFWTFDNFNNREFKLSCEFKVALVAGRHSHNGTGTITKQDVISDPDLHELASSWVNSVRTGKDASLFFILLAFDFGFLNRILAVFFDGFLGVFRDEFRDNRMLWSDHHKGSTKQSVWTSGKDGQSFFVILNLKGDFGTFGTTNPVFLGGLDFFWPFDVVDIFEKFISIGSNLEEPLLHLFLFYFVATAPAFAVFDLFVREHSLVDWAPPLVGFLLVGETFFVKLKEAPLSPLVIFWVGSIDFAIPVDSIAEPFSLLTEIINIDLGDVLWGGTGLDSVVFGRETKGIVAKWTHYVHLLLFKETGEHINNREVTDVTDM